MDELDGFKILPKGGGLKKSINANELSINKSYVAFGMNAQHFIGNAKFIEVFINLDSNLVAFKASFSAKTGYSLQRSGSYMNCNIGKLQKVIPAGRYPIKAINGDYLIIKVPEIAFQQRKNTL